MTYAELEAAHIKMRKIEAVVKANPDVTVEDIWRLVNDPQTKPEPLATHEPCWFCGEDDCVSPIRA